MFQGSIAALITPFTSDLKVDYSSFATLIEWHIQEGTDALVICGTTGEAPTLTSEEQLKLFKIAAAIAAGRIPIIAGTGCYNTRESVMRTHEAKQLGADACLIINPYYNRPTPEGNYLHFEAIAKVGLPIIIYHHPGRTGTKLSPQALAKIASIPEVVAIKEATTDVAYFQELLQLTKKNLLVGDDLLVLPTMEVGGKGVISIAANVIPKEWKRLTQLMLQGKKEEGKALYKKVEPLCKALVLESNPQCVKYAMHLLKGTDPQLRLPMIEPTQESKEAIRNCLKI